MVTANQIEERKLQSTKVLSKESSCSTKSLTTVQLATLDCRRLSLAFHLTVVEASSVSRAINP